MLILMDSPDLLSFCLLLNQGMFADFTIMFYKIRRFAKRSDTSPCHPEMGTKATVLGLYPTFLMKLDVSLTISSYRDSDHLVVSILLIATMSCLTPKV